MYPWLWFWAPQVHPLEWRCGAAHPARHALGSEYAELAERLLPLLGAPPAAGARKLIRE